MHPKGCIAILTSAPFSPPSLIHRMRSARKQVIRPTPAHETREVVGLNPTAQQKMSWTKVQDIFVAKSIDLDAI